MSNNFFSHIRSDLPASIVVFLVAVPLCLGISLASGAPLMAGIISGIVGGLIVTLFSGSPLGVSGPAAGLIVVVYSSIVDLGSFEAFLVAGMLAGVLQVILGFLKAGIVAHYFPSSVIKGMLSAIGIIIVLKQIPHAFGYDGDFEGDLAFNQPDGENTFSELINMLDYISPSAVIISSLGLIILILWEMRTIKNSVAGKIPGPLIVVLLGILLNILFEYIDFYPLEELHMVNVPVIQNWQELRQEIIFPDFSFITNPEIWKIALVLAIVASIETLLSLEATDKLDPRKRISPTNQELKAQGIGNVLASFIGGLPITMVIVRSSANIQAGGVTRASSLLHGIWLLLFVAIFPSWLNLIPLSSLAAILLIIGYKLAKPQLFVNMRSLGNQQFVPFIITILAIIFTDLLTGIIIGIVVAVFFILYNNYRRPFFVRVETNENGEKEVHLKLAEDVTFLNKARILNTLKNIPPDVKIIIDGSESINIDSDVMEIIKNYSEDGINSNRIEVTGIFKSPDYSGDKDSLSGKGKRLREQS